jgi:branched-chain amino acid aminotransferase
LRWVGREKRTEEDHVNAAANEALHFIDGKWVKGNPLILRAFDHATWLMAGVFDGARAFEGVTPDLDLHCRRAVRSARNMGLRSPLSPGEIQEIVLDGIAKFPGGTPLYIRPFMWSTEGWMEPDPASTRIAISLTVEPMPEAKPKRVMLSRFRRPSPETAPTDAKAVCLYAQAGRAAGEATSKGFDDAVMLDPLGSVAEFSAANLWIAKDGAAITPVHNGCFLNGITRQRLIKLFEEAGVPVYEKALSFGEVLEADEVFSTGNFGKVLPITAVEDEDKPIGPIYRMARRLYWDYAHKKN